MLPQSFLNRDWNPRLWKKARKGGGRVCDWGWGVYAPGPQLCSGLWEQAGDCALNSLELRSGACPVWSEPGWLLSCVWSLCYCPCGAAQDSWGPGHACGAVGAEERESLAQHRLRGQLLVCQLALAWICLKEEVGSALWGGGWGLWGSW